MIILNTEKATLEILKKKILKRIGFNKQEIYDIKTDKWYTIEEYIKLIMEDIL